MRTGLDDGVRRDGRPTVRTGCMTGRGALDESRRIPCALCMVLHGRRKELEDESQLVRHGDADVTCAFGQPFRIRVNRRREDVQVTDRNAIMVAGHVCGPRFPRVLRKNGEGRIIITV